MAAALVTGGVLAFGGGNSGDQRSPAADAAALVGPVWRLLGYDHQQQLPASTATFVVDRDGRFVADDSCTVYSGRVDPGSGALHPSTLESPRERRCTDTVGEVTFQRLWNLLPDAPSYEIAGDELTIEHAGTTAHLKASTLPAPTTDVPALTGATWLLTAVADGTGATVDSIPRATTFRLADGQLRASDGCNSVAGPAHLDGTTLRTTGLSVTAMACPGVETEGVADGVLTDGATLEQDGPRLTVRKAGAGSLTYQWQPDDADATDPANLDGHTWLLESVAGDVAAGTVRLRFDGRHLTGNDGCQDLATTVQVNDGWFTTGGAPKSTPSDCDQRVADQASTIDSFLNSRTTLWSIRNDRLVIQGGGAQGFSLVFGTDNLSGSSTPHGPSPVGHAWRLASVERSHNGVDSNGGAGPTTATLTIDPDGSFRVTSPCGSWNGRLTAGDGTLTIDDPGAGPAANCPAGSFGTDLGDVLTGTVDWENSGGQLRLHRGEFTLTFDS